MVHPGSGFFPIPDPGSVSLIQGSKQHRVLDPDQQHCPQEKTKCERSCFEKLKTELNVSLKKKYRVFDPKN
jgi:hypothetical protein